MEYFSIYLLLIQDIFTSYLIFGIGSDSIFDTMIVSKKYHDKVLISLNMIVFSFTMGINYLLGYIFKRLTKISNKNVNKQMHKNFLYVLSIFPQTVSWANFFSSLLGEARISIKIFISSLLFNVLHIFIIYIKFRG